MTDLRYNKGGRHAALGGATAQVRVNGVLQTFGLGQSVLPSFAFISEVILPPDTVAMISTTDGVGSFQTFGPGSGSTDFFGSPSTWFTLFSTKPNRQIIRETNTSLNNAAWGEAVDLRGSTVVVGAPGKSRVAVYELGDAETLHALADDVMVAVGRRHVAQDVGHRADLVQVGRHDLVLLGVALQDEHDLALLAHGLRAAQLTWIAGEPPSPPYTCTAKIRYRQADQPCTLLELDGSDGLVRFAQPQRAVTPGQSVVFYDGEICLGGGVIEAALP